MVFKRAAEVVRTGLVMILVVGHQATASAQGAEQFYRGKSVTLQVGYAPGGGYDTYARGFARHYGSQIPGKPTVVVQNVPGAGSLKLTNALYNSAPRDGSVIGSIGREQVTAPLFGVSGVQFDATKLNWLGNLDAAASLCVAWHTSPFKSIEDLKSSEMVVGGTGPASITVVLPTVLAHTLGYRFKVVAGYPGGNDINLALERGEVQGRCGWSYASIKTTQQKWLNDGKLRFLSISSFKRHKDLPGVPTVTELAKTDSHRQVLELVLAGQSMARPFVAPPDVPAERLQALRDAFAATVKDAAFLADAAKQNLELDPMGWAEMTEVVKRIYATPPDVVKAAIEAVARAK